MKKLLFLFALVFSLFANAQKKEVQTDSVSLYTHADGDTDYKFKESQASVVTITYTKDSMWITNGRHSVFVLDKDTTKVDLKDRYFEYVSAVDEDGVNCVVSFYKDKTTDDDFIIITYSNVGVTYKLKKKLPSL